jgi:hypothetical protein
LAAKEGAMCGFAYGLIDVEGLDPTESAKLAKELKKRKDALEVERAMIDASIKTVDDALKKALKKSKTSKKSKRK